jgi:hypothetical protein
MGSGAGFDGRRQFRGVNIGLLDNEMSTKQD